MSNDSSNKTLSVDTLRDSIIKLITRTLSDENSYLTKTLNEKITYLTSYAIKIDNDENDINWGETGELFGDYTDNNSNTIEQTTSTVNT